MVADSDIEMFEALVGASVANRVVPKDSESELIEFTVSLDKGNRLGSVVPCAAARAGGEAHREPQESLASGGLADVLAQDAGLNAGLWIATEAALPPEIGRASCRERVYGLV